MLDVHLVLDELDDGEDEVGVAQPAEHIVEDGHVLVLDALGDAMRERREHHAGNMRSHQLDIASYGKGIVVGITGHTDDQVDIGILEHMVSLLGGRHLCERGWITQSELHILVEKFFIDTAIILEHKGIVGIGHYQDIEDALGHQVDKRHILQKEVVKLLRYVCIHRLFRLLPAKVVQTERNTKEKRFFLAGSPLLDYFVLYIFCSSASNSCTAEGLATMVPSGPMTTVSGHE